MVEHQCKILVDTVRYFQQVHIIPIMGVGTIYQRCTLKVAAAKVGALVSADVS